MIGSRSVLWGRVLTALSFFGAAAGWAWIPSGGPQQQLRLDCLAQDLEDGLIERAGDPPSQNAFVRSFFSRCAEHLSRHAPVGVIAQAQTAQHMGATEFKGFSRFVRREVEILPGVKVPMMIAAQPGLKRPLLLIQCGLGCQLSSPMMFQALMSAYEEGPFHVAFLTSTSSDEFELPNHAFTMGGVFEGMIVNRAAQLFASAASPVADLLPPEKIDGVHVLGTSLGGHAALFAALDASEDGHGVLSSIGLCPVVDFKVAVEELGVHPREPLVGDMFFKKMLTQMKAVYPQVPDLQGIFNPAVDPSPVELESIVARASLRFLERQGLLARLNRFGGASSESGFWEAHDFTHLAAAVRIPTFLWAADNDYVVSALGNSVRLDGMNRDIGVLHTSLGAHCFYGESFGWDITSSLMRGLVEANSPSLLASRHMRSASLAGVKFGIGFRANMSWQQRLSFNWLARTGSAVAELMSEIYDPSSGGEECNNESACASRARAEIPLKLLGLTAPRTDIEAEAMSRWLNANVRLSGHIPGHVEHNELPLVMEWPEYVAR